MPLNAEQQESCFLFGDFRYDSAERVLYRRDDPVPLPPKAALTLLVLLRNAPRLVEKEELLKQVWPDTFVEEGNLTHNISLLRKTLGNSVDGKGYIETVPRRGYRFAGVLGEAEAPDATIPALIGPAESTVIAPPRRWLRVAATLALFMVAFSFWYQRTESSVQPPPARGGTHNPAAYQEYLNGRLFYTNHDPKSLERAVAAFERAVQLDRGYAAAYAGLAEAYYLLGQHQSSTTSFERMSAAAKTALELDPNLPSANAVLGLGEALTHWRWEDGERHIRRAIELDANYTSAHIFLSIVLMRRGRPGEALAAAQQALAVEPFHEVLPWLFANIYYNDRQYDQALEWIHKSHTAGTRFGSLAHLEATILALRGQCTEAIHAVKGATLQSREQMGAYGFVAARCGHASEARAMERRLRAVTEVDGGTTAYFQSMIDLGRGRKPDALRELKVAYEGRSGYLPRIKSDPVFDPLHAEPEYQRLLIETGLGTKREPSATTTSR